MGAYVNAPSTVEPPPLRVLICGSRNWPDRDAVTRRVVDLPKGSLVISGGARGADTWAAEAAEDIGYFVAEMRVAKAHWRTHGKSAGHRRNRAMLDLCPDLVIAFQHEGSRGTQGTIDEARRRGIPLEVHTSTLKETI
jgi:hypothetical protein